MSETTATPTTAAPAAPVVPPPAATSAPKPIEPSQRHPALKGLMSALQKQSAPGDDPKPKETPVETPAAPPPAADAPPPAPPEKPIKVSKKKGPERPPLPIAAPVPPVAPTAPSAPAPVSTQKIEDILSEDELAMLEDARDMEKLLGQKHAGLGQRTEKFMRENKSKLDQLKKEGVDPETDQEYQSWLKSAKPTVSARDYEQLRVERTTSRVSQQSSKEIDDLKHELVVRDEEPKIRREIDTIYSELARTALPDDVQSELQRLQKEHGPQKGYEMMQKTHKLELDISERVMDAATKDMELFIKLTRETPTKRPLVAFNQSNPDHVRIAQMIGDTCQAFKENGPRDQQVRDGKWFVTRDEWNQMAPESRGNFWTFTNAELLKVAQRGIKPVIMKSIEAKKKEIESIGYSRSLQPAAAPSTDKPAAAPVATPSSSVRPSPIPTSPAVPPAVDPRASALNARLEAGRKAP